MGTGQEPTVYTLPCTSPESPLASPPKQNYARPERDDSRRSPQSKAAPSDTEVDEPRAERQATAKGQRLVRASSCALLPAAPQQPRKEGKKEMLKIRT